MSKNDYSDNSGKVLDADLCDRLDKAGYALKDIQRELSLQTPATDLDEEAFKRRHPLPVPAE